MNSDSSKGALGVVLLQKDDNDDLHPIAYASKTSNAAQMNYNVSEKECLGLVWGLEHFNTYLEGHSYTCITDHKALTYLIANKECPNSRITRWILRLQPYNLKVEYIKGADNHTADLLSRPDLMNNSMNVQHDEKHIYVNGMSTRGKQQLYYVPPDTLPKKVKNNKRHDQRNQPGY